MHNKVLKGLNTSVMLHYIVLLFVSVKAAEPPCVKIRGSESYACVCNTTYCDSFRRMEVLPNTMNVYTSAKDGGRLKLSRITLNQNDGMADHMITVSQSILQQEVFGFGGAMTDAAVFNIRSLPPVAQAKILQQYFSPEEFQYTFIRVPLACTDFSTIAYSYDEIPYDYLLLFFQLGADDIVGKIPLIREAISLANGRLKLLGGAWSAPSWIKNDGKILSGGNIRLDMYGSWSLYYIKFLEKYRANGLNFWGITNGNEPISALVSTGWSETEMRRFLSDYLGPALRTYFPEVKLLLLDDFPERLPSYTPILANRSSRQFIDGVAFHPYTGPGPLKEYSEVLHQSYPDKFILQSEFSVGVNKSPAAVVLGSWSRAEQYAENIIVGFQNWAVGFIDWNLALDTSGGPTFVGNNVDGPIIVNRRLGVWYKQPFLYVIAHFSAFIPPGSRIVPVKVTPDGLLVTAAMTESSVVVVILNKGNRTKTAAIQSTGGPISGKVTLPPKSIVTAIYRPL